MAGASHQVPEGSGQGEPAGERSAGDGKAAFARLQPTILQVVPALEQGGAERTTVDITKAIVEAGGRSLVVSRGGRLVDEVEAAGGEHREMAVHSKNPIVMALNVEHLARLVVREGVDLVHARSRAPAWSALAAARRTGKPFVTTYHSRVAERPRAKVFYNSVMVRGDAVIANSRYTAQRIREFHGQGPAEIFTVPRGVDLEAFSPAAVTAERLRNARAHLGRMPDDPVTFVLPARLTRWKGQTFAIEAAADLVQTGVADFQVLLVGREQRRGFAEELGRLIAGRGLEGIVSVARPATDMPALYLAADAVLAPSLEPEPFGRIAPEAGAMERVAIVTAHGGACETVIDEGSAPGKGTGFHVSPVSSAGLSDAMRTVIEMSASQRMAIGTRARAHIASAFSLGRMCAKTLGVYAHVLQKVGD